jgi:hypothetical protein
MAAKAVSERRDDPPGATSRVQASRLAGVHERSVDEDDRQPQADQVHGRTLSRGEEGPPLSPWEGLRVKNTKKRGP